MAHSRPPVSGRRRSSIGKGAAAFDAFYTTSYVAPPPVKRSASDTFLYDRGREAHHRARQEERRRIRDELEHERKDSLSTCQLFCLTLCMVGVQFTWTVELAYGTPYLLSLGLPKEMTALVWLAGPLSGLIIQPLIGAFSDKCTLALGKRRPFIIVGAIFVCLSMLCIAYAKDIAAWIIHLSDDTGIPERLTEQERRTAIVVAVIAFYTLDFSLNAVQASCRALILDIPPLLQQQEANAWAARLSNVAMVVGYFTGFIDLVKAFPFLGNSQIKVFCLIAVAVFIATIGMTCLTIHEEQNTEEYDESPWYYTFAYIWKALRSLPGPIQRLCNVQFFAWLGWFPFLFYSTTWVSDLYFASHPQNHPDSWAKGTRAGSFALLLYAIISVVSGTILPWLVSCKPCNCWLLTLKNFYTTGNLIFSLAMLSTIMVTSVTAATIIVAIIGIPWSVVLWIPFALVGEYVTVPADVLHEEEEDEREESRLEQQHDEETRPITENRGSPTQHYGATTNGIHTPVSENDADEEELDAGMVLGVHNMYIVFPQFAVAVVASMIFRVVQWVENGQGEERPRDGQSANVAWVLLFGGFMSLVATVLSRRIIQVPDTTASKTAWPNVTITDSADRVSV